MINGGNAAQHPLTTVNYFITNPNFAPQQQTTNNIIIMNKRMGSASQKHPSSLHPPSSQNVKRKLVTDNDSEIEKPKGDHMAKLFGNEKNFHLIKSLMEGGSQASTNATNTGYGSRGGGIGAASFSKARHPEIITDKEVKVEKALLDLNELKTQMFQEASNTKDFSPAALPRKVQTVTNNFFRDTAYSGSNQKLMSGTSTSNFFGTQSNFNPAGSLTSNLDNLDAGQLKERLLVAETLMKKLYNRNKELETFHKLKQSDVGVASSVTPSKPQNKPESPSEYKQELENELEEKQKVIERLQTEV